MDEKLLRDEIAACCRSLRLSSNFVEQAMAQHGETPQEYMLKVLQEEVEYRRDSRILRYLSTAGFPKRYDPASFRTAEVVFPDDAGFQDMLDLKFYSEGKNIIMYGGSGTGKTMLSIIIGQAACQQGIPVKFYRTAAIVNLLAESHARGNLSQIKRKLDEAKILILDEFGYVPYDRTGSQLLFDYLSEIHEQKPVILNTNLEFSQWVNVLYDEYMTTALIGRLTHHVDLILFPGQNRRILESRINEVFTRNASRT